MEINRIEIRYWKKGGLDTVYCEGVTHVKILPYLSVVQSVEGSYGIGLGNEIVKETGAGGFFLAPAQVQQTIVHHVDPNSDRMQCRWVFLDAVINGRYRFDQICRLPVIPDKQTAGELNRLLDRLFETADPFLAYSLCYRILGVLFGIATPVRVKGDGGVEQAVDRMKADFGGALSVQELAAACCMSPSNFYAVFKKQYGISPMAYLNRYRLSVAAEMLAETDESIKEIGDSVGIKDPLYFSKQFKKTYSVSPREYRLFRRMSVSDATPPPEIK